MREDIRIFKIFKIKTMISKGLLNQLLINDEINDRNY